MEEFPAGTDLAAHPNDAFFKAVFSEPEQATAFFKKHLPPAISASIDWTSLTVLPTSFVKSSLRQIHSDLLFSVRIGDRETMLYLLFEHQSTVDPSMPLRLLGYVTEILANQFKTHGLPLPPVLPFVLHQGPERWSVSTKFEDLFALPDDLAHSLQPYLPKFDYALLDLSNYDPAQEEDHPQLRIILNLMKLAREQELLRFFTWLAETLSVSMPDSLLRRLLLYALHADSKLDTQEIYRSLKDNPDLKERAMSVAEKLKAEGRVEGRVEGRAEGLSQGLWIGKIQLLEEFLGQEQSSSEFLKSLSLEELESLHMSLHQAYEVRFKSR